MNKTVSKICTACGTQFPPSVQNPDLCPICEDDRQYVPETGQSWTTRDELLRNHGVEVREIGERLYDLRLKPSFAIGQRAFLVCAPLGNVLWDCIPLLNDQTIEFIRSKGGLNAIAFSHPHFYSNMSEWAKVFDCPIYIHKNDEKWIVNGDDHVELWHGTEKELWNRMRLINIGGHFPGSSILHIPFLSPKGTVLCGDTFVLSPSKRHFAVMHSYPNKIPLPVIEIARIARQFETLEFDTVHAWEASQSVLGNARELLTESLAKYV